MILNKVDVSSLVLSLFGLHKLPRNVHLCIRAIIYLNHVSRYFYDTLFAYRSERDTIMRCATWISMLCFNTQVMYLYWQRSRNADSLQKKLRYGKGAGFLLLILLIASLSTSITSLLSFVAEPVDYLVLSHVLVKMEALFLCVDIAEELRRGCLENEIILSGLDSQSASAKCMDSSNFCCKLSGKLNGPLTSLYAQFFVKMVAQIPVKAHLIQCSVSLVSWLIAASAQLAGNFLVIAMGERILDLNRKARRRVRLTETYFTRDPREIELFVRQEHGVCMAFGVPLGWKSTYAFLGIAWGFSFTAFQIVWNVPVPRTFKF